MAAGLLDTHLAAEDDHSGGDFVIDSIGRDIYGRAIVQSLVELGSSTCEDNSLGLPASPCDDGGGRFDP